MTAMLVGALISTVLVMIVIAISFYFLDDKDIDLENQELQDEIFDLHKEICDMDDRIDALKKTINSIK